jgi:hypothetical protein
MLPNGHISALTETLKPLKTCNESSNKEK